MIITNVVIGESKSDQQVTVSLNDSAKNESHKIKWNETQLQQNGRFKALNLKTSNGDSMPVNYDENKLSRDVYFK